MTDDWLAIAPELEIPALRDGDTYIFFLPRPDSWSGKQYRINGKPVDGGNNYSTTGEPTVEIYRKQTRQVRARSKVEDIPDLSMVEYLERKDALGPTEPPQYEDESGKRFRDLDAEYAYKRFIQAYDIETCEVWEPNQRIRLVVQDKITPPNRFIVPGRHMDKGIADQGGHYFRFDYIVDLTKRILTENGYVDEEDKTKKAPKALTFKIYTYQKGEISVYIAGGRVFEVKGWPGRSDQMSTLLAMMEEDREMVEKELMFFLAGTKRTVNAYQVANILERALERVQKIDSKVATASEKRNACNYLREQIERMKALESMAQDDAEGGLEPTLAGK